MSELLRILHLVATPTFSGPLPPTLILAQAQRRLGHAVHLGIDRKRRQISDYEEDALQPVRQAGFEPVPLELSSKSTPWKLWQDRRSLSRFCEGQSIDVLHVHSSHDHVLARIARPQSSILVRTFHAPRTLKPGLARPWLHRTLNGAIVRCELHQQELLKRGWIFPDAVARIAGSVDHELFHPADALRKAQARAHFGLPEHARVIVQAALMADRGQEELMGALIKLNAPDLHLLFAGSGKNENALKLLAKAAGLEGKCHFPGYLHREELIQAYAAADAAFVARAGNDASVRAALEALASGLPLLAVQTETLSEIVSPEIGYAVAERSAESIAEAVRIWKKDPESAQKAEMARKTALQRFSPQQEAEQTVAFYRILKAES